MVSDASKLDSDYLERERLFHYTSSAGLYGILESGCIWATHFRFLNDTQEIFKAKEPLVRFVRSALHRRLAVMKVSGEIRQDQELNLKEIAHEQAKSSIESMYAATLGSDENGIRGAGHPYIFSAFCCTQETVEDFRNGALVHWASYGRGGGYALQINPHTLRSLLDNEAESRNGMSFMSRKVSYVTADELPDEFKERAEKISSIIIQIVLARARQENFEEIDASEALAPFVSTICSVKDAFFAPEKEARVVIFHLARDDKSDVKYHSVNIRQTGSMAIPYIKILDGFLLNDGGKAIERILIGPHPDNERRAIALSSYLRARRLGNIDVALSTVPLVTQLG